MTAKGNKAVFIQAGEPLAVMGAATRTMVRKNDALAVGPDNAWANRREPQHHLDRKTL